MATVVSCPGKVLLAGGYLVLEPKYQGLVVSTSSRFYTCIDDSPDTTNLTAVDPSTYRVIVRSPQFEAAEWIYDVTLDGGKASGSTKATVGQTNSIKLHGENTFVSIALQRTINLALEYTDNRVVEALSKTMVITIVGDNDFYSQRKHLDTLGLLPSIKSLSEIPPFNHTGAKLSEVHKTGLGSSAALITSLVTCLLIRFAVISKSDLDPEPKQKKDKEILDGLTLAHNLAQYVHCFAQGKVGSGFDVSSAVYGSHIYKRFKPDVLTPLMDDSDSVVELKLHLAVKWDNTVEHFDLPKYTRLVLADVHGGSNTPSLIRQVLKWKKDKPAEAEELWGELDESNRALATGLRDLTRLESEHPSEYESVLSRCASRPHSQWGIDPVPPLPLEERKVRDALLRITGTSQAIRWKIKAMGEKATDEKVGGIEPREQTALLNKCINLPGVIGGGVPGAGGYDAIWLLVIFKDKTFGSLEEVEEAWRAFPEESDFPEMAKLPDISVSPLSAYENRGIGVRVETVEDVAGLQKVLEKSRNPPV